jgi:hypothetical protein
MQNVHAAHLPQKFWAGREMKRLQLSTLAVELPVDNLSESLAGPYDNRPSDT